MLPRQCFQLLPGRIGDGHSIALTGGAIYGSFADVPRPTLLAPIYALIWAGVGLKLYLSAGMLSAEPTRLRSARVCALRSAVAIGFCTLFEAD